METYNNYKEVEDALDRIFDLRMELLQKDAEINALRFELELSKRIQESLGQFNRQMLSGLMR